MSVKLCWGGILTHFPSEMDWITHLVGYTQIHPMKTVYATLVDALIYPKQLTETVEEKDLPYIIVASQWNEMCISKKKSFPLGVELYNSSPSMQ